MARGEYHENYYPKSRTSSFLDYLSGMTDDRAFPFYDIPPPERHEQPEIVDTLIDKVFDEDEDPFHKTVYALLVSMSPILVSCKDYMLPSVSDAKKEWLFRSKQRWESIIDQAFGSLNDDPDKFRLVATLSYLVGHWEEWEERTPESNAYLLGAQAYVFTALVERVLEIFPECIEESSGLRATFADVQEYLAELLRRTGLHMTNRADPKANPEPEEGLEEAHKRISNNRKRKSPKLLDN